MVVHHLTATWREMDFLSRAASVDVARTRALRAGGATHTPVLKNVRRPQVTWPIGIDRHGKAWAKGGGIMTGSSGSRGSLSGHLGLIVVAVVVTGLAVFVACFMVWYHLGGGAWRSGVSVSDAKLGAPHTLILTVDSCLGAPRVAQLQETDVDVQVKVIAFSTPMHGGADCQESVKAYLEEPLGDRMVVDKHSGRIVSDTLHPFADAQPQSNWRIVEVTGLPNLPGFSLRLPFGWELHELQGIDSFLGEVIGDDGIRLTIVYGGSEPAVDPAHLYVVALEEIGGHEAKLHLPMKGGGYTSVYFANLGGPSLSLVGEHLSPNQLEPTIAVFRSIRLLGQ